MSEEENESNKGGGNNINASIDAVTGLVKAVPIYEDAVQPVAKQIGKSLEIVGKAVNAALMPIQGLVWGAETIQAFLKDTLSQKLKDVPPEDIVSPKPNIAGPAIESLRYTGHEDSLKDMYANLLAAAMNKNTADQAHPAFVEIIKQLTPDEAKLIAFFLSRRKFPIVTVRARKESIGTMDMAVNVSLFGEQAGLECPAHCPVYIDNLCRLGLVEIPEGLTYSSDETYDELLNSPAVLELKKNIEDMDHVSELKFEMVRTTSFGKQFGAACVVNRS
ncbi:DUF4393 domain-containing protein [Pseudomonas syringae Cit 7]|uniref:DUF4393 domain-containing protein n=1 Tax=Pseudomonas syringae Cit 7 TaxID=629264 RepID=A0A8T8M346_PSESX|nr:DUF4393 domain-containing protein [Pseudomonas syringae]QUP67967.1 DUF4393 domain-containing protein [Pseudomonas syringae Cit 7]SDS28914.1 protein of unknown function [Pseudomonas syringae]